jgi:hypothetical protein
LSHGTWIGSGILLLVFPFDRLSFISGALNVATSLLFSGLSLFVAAPLHGALERDGIQGNPAYRRLILVSRIRVLIGMFAVVSQCAVVYFRCTPD